MAYIDHADPNYMPLAAPHCHVQVPVLSAVGRGPKGDKGDTGDKGDLYYPIAIKDQGIPEFNAEYVGQIYINMTDDTVYIAKNTSGDWIAINR